MKPQAQDLVKLFSEHGYRLTLHQIMQTSFAAEYRARITEIRQEGYTVTCERGETPGENTYRMIPPDKNGQIRWVA